MKKILELDETYESIELQYPFASHFQGSRGKGVMTSAHWHYFIEILYCLRGTARAFLGGEPYVFKEGDMVLMNSREVHSVYGETEGDDSVQYIVIRFDPEVLYSTSKSIFESKYVLPFTMSQSTHQKVFSKDEIGNTEIPNLLKEILNEYTNKNYGFELAIRTHICRIFLWILRNWQEKGMDLNIDLKFKESDIQRLQFIFDYLDKNYQENITAEHMAKLCSMSYSYFSRFFKASIGKTFSEYLNYVRITEAEKLLISTEKNITEIAQETGFSTSSYFIQQFKHFKGISPKQFKKRIHG